MSALASRLYEGRVMHSRSAPRTHRFAYRVHLFYLDLDELDRLPLRAPLWSRVRFGLLSFRREDYLGDPRRPLAGEVKDLVAARLGRRPRGPVRLLTQVRFLGSVFNPVSFYYCFAEDGRTLEALVAEITNTPWRERHAYVLDAGPCGARAEFDKEFHVSPFFPMTQRYRWSASAPGRCLTVRMTNHENGEQVFEARLGLVGRALTNRAVLGAALRQPFGSWRVLLAIWWQALLLWRKRTPFFQHPARLETARARATTRAASEVKRWIA